MPTHCPTPPYPSFRGNQNILLAGVVTAILLVVAMAIAALIHLRHEAEARATLNTRHLVKTLELTVEGLIDKIDLSLQASVDEISQQMASGHPDAQAITRFLERQQERLPQLSHIRATNERGDALYGKGIPSPPANYADRDYFIRLRDDPHLGFIVGKPLLGRINKKWTWPFFRRINRPDGSFGGIVFAGIEIQRIEDDFAQIRLDAGSAIGLRDTDLGLIARYPSANSTHTPIGDQHLSIPFSATLQANPQEGAYNSGATSIDQVSRTHAYRRNAKYGFVINTGVSDETALAEWHKQMGIIGTLVAAYILLSLAFARSIRRAWLRQEQDMGALMDSRQALHEAQKIAHMGSYLYDLRTDCWTSSDTLDEIFGIDNEYLRTAGGWLELVVAQSRQEMQAYLSTLVEQRQRFDREYCIVRPSDGQERWVHGQGELQLDAQGTPLRLLGSIQDITERKRSEAELEKYRHHLEERVAERTAALSIAKEAAEAANRAKSTFLSNMSHELRTPMSAIMGMTTLALRRATDAKQIDQLTKVTQASQRLLGIINDILDLSKIEAERLHLEQTPFKLGSILENLSSLIGQKVSEKGLQLGIDLTPADATLPLQGDPLRLGQILLNLTGNALKFTDQGSVIISVRRAEEQSEEVLLRFEVRDTGIGISADDQKRLFTAFEQADGSMTRRYGGTGLGLAIRKRLTQMMGGQIGVDSQPGNGSTFWFTVRLSKDREPLATEDNPTPYSAEETLKTQYAGTHLLLVEDEPVNQEVSRELLEALGFTVDLANDGIEAVERAKNTDYALILMDVQMPHMNGMDATQAIRALPGRAATPILAMTANAFDEDRQRCIDAGMNDHIGKPVDPEVLFQTLLKWLARAT